MNEPMDIDIHALSGAYAVDALDDLERARFERHLDQCAACREEVASLQESTAELASLSATPPPPALRDRVMDEIRSVRPLPPQPEREDTSAEVARRRTPKWRAVLAAACLVGVVGAGAVVAEQVLDDESSQSLSAIDRVLTAADARSVTAKMPDGASARVVHSPSEGKAVLLTSRMPAAPAGHVYELWLQTSAGDMVPSGLMDASGNQKVLFEGDASDATAAGITIEPAGGSEQPTTAPIALFDFSKAT